MAQPKVTLYFDVVSPWSKVAWYVLRRYQKPWNLDLVRAREYGEEREREGLNENKTEKHCQCVRIDEAR